MFIFSSHSSIMASRLPLAALLFLTTSLVLSTASVQTLQGALHRYPPTFWAVQAYTDNFDITNNERFTQKILSYDKWWRSGGPILLYLGNEGPIEGFYNYTGAIFEHAQELNASVVFIEHRYYGSSIPKGKHWHHLTVEQAMADYAWFVPTLRNRLKCGSLDCPIVTFGGSYGGMLVAWFRQKYPHLTVGGVAASAPIDFYPHTGVQKEFWNAVSHTFSAFGTPSCTDIVTKALQDLQVQAASAAGRTKLSNQLASCDPLENETTAGEKADFFLRGAFASLAMLDYPVASAFVTPLPANPVRVACEKLKTAANSLEGLRAVADLYLNGTGQFRCYDILAEIVGRPTEGIFKGPKVAPDMGPWQYQTCNELILEPITTDGMGFYPPSDEQLSSVAAACELRYGVTPRPAWLPVSTGGSRLRVGNLLFTDGEKDPWRAGAVRIEQVPKGLDVVHHLIPGSAHHEDLRFNAPSPNPEVVKAKQMALAAMQRWIRTGYTASESKSLFV
eukprot:TRINITY_DN18212_c0_g4_i1.p1 TRINITY_DN18212_c0_g4~~TRINITY_DN18212_c0_g4_i1.p1  ORF type:complete len:504 (-),score=68.37 TRINITY_DN18212_c0_g4_i1:113-1624(-)